MSFELRLIVLALAAFGVTSLAISALVPWVAARVTVTEPGARASRLLAVRLAPVVSGVVVAALTLASCLLFEPRVAEDTGWVLPAAAAISLTGGLAAAARLVRTTVGTRRLVAGWTAGAEPIQLERVGIPALRVDTRFPLVAVVGIVRPRLLVARSVLDACTKEEIQAILDHERAHLERGDNLRRSVMLALPDALASLPAGRSIVGAWQEAAEEAADDAAGRDDERGRVALAQALVRVARLAAPGARLEAEPASALYCGNGLDRRVRRLLRPAVPATRRPGLTKAGAALGLVAGLLSLGPVHRLVEAAVLWLP